MPGRSLSLMNQPKIDKDRLLLARRLFVLGCFGLPWLWLVTSFYFRRLIKEKEQELALASLEENEGEERQNNHEIKRTDNSVNRTDRRNGSDNSSILPSSEISPSPGEDYIRELKKCKYSSLYPHIYR